MDGTKRAIRQEMRRRRRALDPAVRAAAEKAVADHACALSEFARAPVVLAYAATDGEVPTSALLAAAAAAGKRVFLPRCVGAVMTFAEYSAAAGLQPGAFGIPEPLGDDLEDADLRVAIAFVPLVAWDRSGARLGRGGGHYDRFLAGPSRPQCLVGLGYAFQQCARLPRDRWDLRLDAVVTEEGVHRCWDGDVKKSPSRKEATQRDGISIDGAGQHRPGRRPRVAGGLPPPPTR
jgi:5-formyltetrahydrofolate cyclo-ligase